MTSEIVILTLPTEVVEEFLVHLVEIGDPKSISRLAQTCRHFRQLVYDPLDKVLWRRIFLTTFDDPRTHGSGVCESDSVPFDWDEEFRVRIWTESYIQRRIESSEQTRENSYRLRSKHKASPTSEECNAFAKALHTLVWVLDTTAHAVNHDAEARSVGKTLSTGSLADADTTSPANPIAVDADHPSKNVGWLRSVTAHGLPQEFHPRFSRLDVDPYWLTVEDVQAVHKLVAFLGFNFDRTWARKAPLGRTTPPRPRAKSARCEFVSTDRSDLTPEELVLRARYLARRQVFNVNYLSHRRAWGPFRVYNESGETGEEDQSEDHESESDDPDYVPKEVVDTEASSEDEEYVPPTPVRHKPPPAPENLRADWVHLAAIRMVAQASLQEHMRWDEVRDTLTSWDNYRPGAWLPVRPTQATTEWDWAGVEGVWRRCVCWLDYSELYYHNRHGFRSADFDEATLIVPLVVRIVGYSPCTMPGYEHRPTIHVEGEMGGPTWVEGGEFTGQDVRRIYGTVGMIKDGNIRWSITSSVAGSPQEDEWASEGVQVGGPGSACGVLGLWTGAQHDPNDPIGGWWQWRVA